MIFPYDNVDMGKQLDLLSQGKHGNGIPFIQRYESEGVKYIQIFRWNKHQKPHHTEKESIFPPAPDLKEKENTPTTLKEHEKEIKIMGKQLEASTELRNGELTVKRPLDKLTDDEFLLSLKEKFTWIDFDQVMVKMDAWLLAHPDRKKTRRFIVNWLNKIEKPIQTVKTASDPIPNTVPYWLGDALKEGFK